MTKNSWKFVQQFYFKTFGIPPYVLNLISIQDVLLKSLQGYSNYRISDLTGFSIPQIKIILEKYLYFKGWEDDLEVNPLSIFKISKNFKEFHYKIINKIDNISDYPLWLIFCIIKRYKKIEKEINKYYDRVT